MTEPASYDEALELARDMPARMLREARDPAGFECLNCGHRFGRPELLSGNGQCAVCGGDHLAAHSPLEFAGPAPLTEQKVVFSFQLFLDYLPKRYQVFPAFICRAEVDPMRPRLIVNDDEAERRPEFDPTA